MAAAINSATAEHSPLASTSHSPDCAFRHRSPSPCAATWSLPISHAASASASAMLLVLPDGSARLYTEELTVAQLACDFPDLVVSCTGIDSGDKCDGGVRDDCDSKAQEKESKPRGAFLSDHTVLQLGRTYYLSNRDGPCSDPSAASGAMNDSRRSSNPSSSSYTTSTSIIEDIRNREDYCTSGASISSSGDGSSFSGGSWRTFSSGDEVLCNRSDAGSSNSGNLSAVVSTGTESRRFLSKECTIACHRRSLSLVFADAQMPSPRQSVPCNVGNQQARRSLTPTISRSGELSPVLSHIRSAQRPPATSSPVANRRQFLRTTTPMRDRPIAPRHLRTRTEILGDAPILTDSLVGDAPIAGWRTITSADWASLQDTLRQNKLQLQRSQLQPSQLQPSQQWSRAAPRRRNFSATTAVSPADWMSATPSAASLPRDRVRSPGRARAQLAAHGASGRGAAAAGVVGGTAVDRPVEVCHVAVPAGRALRRCVSHTETRVGEGRVVWWGGEAEQAQRQGEAEAEGGEAHQENDKTRIDDIQELEPVDLGSGGVVNGGDCNEGDTNDLPDSPNSTSSGDSTDSEADANEAFWDSPRCFFSPLSLSLPRSPFTASVPAPSLLSLTNTPTSKSAESPTTVTSATGTGVVHAPVTVTSRPGHTRRRTMDICLPLPSLSPAPATVPAAVSARRGSFSAAQSPKKTPSGGAGGTGGAAAAAFSPSPLRANSGDGIRSAATPTQESSQSSSRSRALLRSMSSRERQRSRENMPCSNLSGTSSPCPESNSGCNAGRNPSPLPWVHARANSLWNSLPQLSSAPLDASWKVQEQNTCNSNGGSTSDNCGSTSSSNSRASSSRTSSGSSRKFSLLNFKSLSISIRSGNNNCSSCTNSPHSPFSPSPSESPIPTASSVSSFDSSFNSSFPHSSTSSSPASSTSSPSSCFSSPSSCFSSHSPSLVSQSHTPNPHIPQKHPTQNLLPTNQLLPSLAHPSLSCTSPTSHLDAVKPSSPHCSHSPHSTASNSSPLPPLPSPSGLPVHVGRSPVSPHSLAKGTGKVVRASRFQRQEGEG